MEYLLLNRQRVRNGSPSRLQDEKIFPITCALQYTEVMQYLINKKRNDCSSRWRNNCLSTHLFLPVTLAPTF